MNLTKALAVYVAVIQVVLAIISWHNPQAGPLGALAVAAFLASVAIEEGKKDQAAKWAKEARERHLRWLEASAKADAEYWAAWVAAQRREAPLAKEGFPEEVE